MESSAPSLFLDPATLRGPVRRLLGSSTADVLSWDAQPLDKIFNEVTGGVYRVRGTARDAGVPLPWSLVLKVCRDPGSSVSADPRDVFYWKREYLANRSGILGELPPGVRAPRCYGTDEPTSGTYWMWLEELTDTYGSSWPLPRYGLAARHAGQFNGAYLSGRPLPSVSWLSTGRARSYVEQWGSRVERLPEFGDHPFVRREFPVAGTTDRVRRLWREREMFLGALARLPQTVSHLDLQRNNLFAMPGVDGNDETVAIDWQLLGTAALGEELAQMVFGSVVTGYEVGHLRELGELAFASYVDGLRDAGWRGDRDLARLGYAAGSISIGLIVLSLAGTIAPEIIPRMERAWGPFNDILDRCVDLRLYTLDLADEARELMEKITSRFLP